MLIQTALKEGDVVSFKLLTTEEVLATYIREDDAAIYFKKVLTIGVTGNGNLGFQPLLLGFDHKSYTGEWSIYKTALAVKPMKTPSELAAEYTRLTSDLVIPSKSSLIV